ncbi:MAG: hypothetical protein AAB486_00825 [Patescibacteria group bacterium]
MSGILRIGLFIGGLSSEKEISLESGRHVYNSLDREKYEVLPIFVDNEAHLWEIEEGLLWKNTTTDLKDALGSGGSRVYYEDLRNKIDFAFICLHGKYGEDAFPGLFEILGIPNNGASVLGGALSMDKYRQRMVLQAAGIDTPKYFPIENSKFQIPNSKIFDEVEAVLSYPVMVKPSREGSSTALHKVNNRGELEAALSDAFIYDKVALVEEVLVGTELTTLVYGEGENIKALPPSELLRGGDFLTAQEKFLPGGAQMITPPRLPVEVVEEVKRAAVNTFQALSLKVYSRIDSFYVPGRGVVILEPNNPPAMTPSTALWLEAAEENLNASQLLDDLIRISLVLHAAKLGPL